MTANTLKQASKLISIHTGVQSSKLSVKMVDINENYECHKFSLGTASYLVHIGISNSTKNKAAVVHNGGKAIWYDQVFGTFQKSK